MRLSHYRGWATDPDKLLAQVRGEFTYAPGEDRATGYLPVDGWPAALADAIDALLGVRFTVVAFQAYRNGAGCGWHADTPFDVQAVVSLGVTRTFGIRPVSDGAAGEPTWIQVAHGDLVVMPSGFQQRWEHCVPVEDAPGERCSIVFRTAA